MQAAGSPAEGRVSDPRQNGIRQLCLRWNGGEQTLSTDALAAAGGEDASFRLTEVNGGLTMVLNGLTPMNWQNKCISTAPLRGSFLLYLQIPKPPYLHIVVSKRGGGTMEQELRTVGRHGRGHHLPERGQRLHTVFECRAAVSSPLCAAWWESSTPVRASSCRGEYENHATGGRQFHAQECETDMPKDLRGRLRLPRQPVAALHRRTDGG